MEINSDALRLFRATFPDAAQHTTLYDAPVERIVRSLPDRAYDVVFSMAVLEHLPRSSEWVLAEMARITAGFLIIIEDEQGESWRHYPRNYRKVFESLGMTQLKEVNCAEVNGLGPSFVARVFERRPLSSRNPKRT